MSPRYPQRIHGATYPMSASELPKTPPATQSIGEKRVRITFVPTDQNQDEVTCIKQTSALLIDLCETLKDKDPRLAAIAQTKIEEAAMWAVKLATA